MKALRLGILVFTAAFMMNSALAADDDRPLGVDEQNWLPISDKLGFVVVVEKSERIGPGSRQALLADPERVSADLMPPKKGYFVIKTKAGWQRIVLSDISEVAG